LVKLGLNQGADLVDRLHRELGAPSASDPDLLDLVIVGAGSSGLGAASRAHDLGMRYQVLEANQIGQTVVSMYKGKVLFAEPESVENRSGMWFEECTREELLERWNAQVSERGLRIREHEKVEDIQRRGGAFEVTSTRGTYRARRVVLAVGKAGNPRKAGVPGETEFADKILHGISDPGLYRNLDILIYGGGDVAAEAALALCETNRITLVTIDPELVFPKKRNVDALYRKQQEGKLEMHLSSRLLRVGRDTVTFADAQGREVERKNDLLLEMIGAELPIPFFRRIGIRLEKDWHPRRWIALAVVSLLVYSLYALKKFPESPYSWPFDRLFSVESFDRVLARIFAVAFLPFRWIFSESAYQDILSTPWFQQGYLYSFAYTLVMIGFGYVALRRWSRTARDPRYQRYRYLSLVTFQVVFFLLANVIAVQALSVQNSWRAWGIYQPWPLFFNTFHWFGESDPRVVVYGFVAIGLFGSFVAIPLAARRHGKRFCTWICGCGGLAETLGDRWRHLAPKGKRSRAWEFQGVVVLIGAAIATLVTVGIYNTRADNIWAKWYSYVVDFWLVAVIPISLYPFFGGKVWCRYWCPLAAWNGLLAKWYGRLRIRSNDKCISCTMCSRYCQVGVDVMSFAKNQAAFDNANSACIQCGICIDVCPMSVLEFDLAPNGKKNPRIPARTA